MMSKVAASNFAADEARLRHHHAQNLGCRQYLRITRTPSKPSTPPQEPDTKQLTVCSDPQTLSAGWTTPAAVE
jgi:hypothetical protein